MAVEAKGIFHDLAFIIQKPRPYKFPTFALSIIVFAKYYKLQNSVKTAIYTIIDDVPSLQDKHHTPSAKFGVLLIRHSISQAEI